MKIKGFTLCEILLVVGIIGIIAELTIPSLIQDFQNKVLVVQTKKTFSTLSNAYKLAEQANGTPENWNLNGFGSISTTMISYLAPYLKISKDCTDGRVGCFNPGVTYKNLNGNNAWVIDDSSYAKVTLADGTLLATVMTYSSSCTWPWGFGNYCGLYFVDVNGYQKPNQFGRDLYVFWLTKTGIVPVGIALETGYSTFSDDCRDKSTATGQSCAGWVIYNENLDYLKCNDLAWGGKTKCD